MNNMDVVSSRLRRNAPLQQADVKILLQTIWARLEAIEGKLNDITTAEKPTAEEANTSSNKRSVGRPKKQTGESREVPSVSGSE